MSLGAGGPITVTNRFVNPVSPLIPDDFGVFSHIVWKGNITPIDYIGGSQWTVNGTPTYVPADATIGMPAGVRLSNTAFFSGSTTLWAFTSDFWGVVICTCAGSGARIVSASDGTTDGWFVNDNSTVASGNGTVAAAVADAGAVSLTDINIIAFGWVASTNTYWIGINGRSHKTGVRTTTTSSSPARILNAAVGGNVYEVMINKSAPSLAKFDAATRAVFKNVGMSA